MEKIANISNIIIVVCTAITAILTIIEKNSKIKWKPISKIFNSEVNQKLDLISLQQNEFMNKLNEIDDVNDKREIKRLRARILEFANQKCEQGIKMTGEQETYFDECCTDYEELIKKHDLQNGHVKQSIKLVNDYRKMELEAKYKKHTKK